MYFRNQKFFVAGMSVSGESSAIPIMGIYKEFPENTETHEINPPKASEPVSPIKIAALFTLNTRKAAATVNCVNLTDGLDGLAGGTSCAYLLILG